MADVTFPNVAAILDSDPYAFESTDRACVTLRRAASAVETIARLINNSILEEGNDEQVALSRKAQSGLLDALELVAVAMHYEVEFAEKQAALRGSP